MAKFSKPKTTKVIFSADKSQITNIGYTGRTYFYDKIHFKNSKIVETTKELGEFSSHLAYFINNKVPDKIESYIMPYIELDRDWVKVIFIKGTPLKVKQAVRDLLINSDFASFVNKTYSWSPATASRDYLAIGPRSKNVGKMWSLVANTCKPLFIRR